MTVEAWVILLGSLLVILGAAWKIGLDTGEIKGGIRELLNRDAATQKRIDKMEVVTERLEDEVRGHGEVISAIKAHIGLGSNRG